MSKLSNILKTIKIIEEAKEPIKKRKIAEEIGVSERMIKKYIDDIKESGYISIISVPGIKGGLLAEGTEKTKTKEPEAKDLFTNEEIIYLKSMLNLEAIDIAEKLLSIADNNQLKEIETELKTLKKQNNIINSIYDKL